MEILVNGKPQELEPGATIVALLEILGLNRDGIAVAVNTRVVPRSRHREHALCAGDRVEVIQAVGGG